MYFIYLSFTMLVAVKNYRPRMVYHHTPQSAGLGKCMR